ncbi:MAG: histidinol-phosphate transaminase [Bacteroidota bacterium]
MSTTNINRRTWLRSASLIGAGLAATPSLIGKATPAGQSWYEGVRTWEKSLAFTPKMETLKARLLANENPFGPSPMAKLAIMESVSLGNRYGHGDAAKLIDMVAEKEGVTKEHILLGPGSTDILEKTAIVHFINGGNVVAADPAYMSLIKTAMAFKAKWKSVPCTDDWAHDLKGMEKAIDSETKLVYICNPNNPTGSLTDSKKLYDFCSKVSERVPVFVDEAYLEFLPDAEKHSMVKLVQEGKNVIVARTFSKIHGMAGLRMGYGVALPETLEKIQKMVRTTMGLNVTTLRGAMASLKDEKFQENTRTWTAEAREYTMDKLKSLGYDPIPSYTSFMLFPLLEGTVGKSYLGKMFDEGIGVRFFEVHDKPYCRVSMGTMDEMKMFVDAFKKVVG